MAQNSEFLIVRNGWEGHNESQIQLHHLSEDTIYQKFYLHTESGKFVILWCTDDDVSFKSGVGDLAADVLVWAADDPGEIVGLVFYKTYANNINRWIELPVE